MVRSASGASEGRDPGGAEAAVAHRPEGEAAARP
jgi:hypothetical protein